MNPTSDTVEHIWVLSGSTGEYSEFSEWVVCAYRTEEDAKKHQQLAQAEADNIKRKRKIYGAVGKPYNKYDPEQMNMDYNGTTYSYKLVELYNSVPAAK